MCVVIYVALPCVVAGVLLSVVMLHVSFYLSVVICVLLLVWCYLCDVTIGNVAFANVTCVIFAWCCYMCDVTL